MAHLRSMDVKILQQLVAVHEGIEACKWLLEERGTLTSRCSSLTSSQYSLGEGPGGDTWRGSWSSLQDPLNDKLDNISIGSYLDTLADDMDEYGPSSSESVLCTTPLGTVTPTRTGAGTGAGAGTGRGAGRVAGEGSVAMAGVGAGSGVRQGTGGKVVVDPGSPQVKPDIPNKESSIWIKATEAVKGTTITKDTKDPGQTQQPSKSNSALDKAVRQARGPTDSARVCLAEKLGKSQSPKPKPYKNGKIDVDAYKMNGKMHLGYDAHWRWVQSQDDVTFL
ncbi:period circadian protein-like isoform X2 [Oncorhynchus keta]|uniref:period circadian protein-like isoform X2 n=1 Tax=Oncorhynchus keta TaxID=8018 RepID=UPI00227AB580|nr:period circadian protein-like isoform X2 [Oncorhynchus keta]